MTGYFSLLNCIKQSTVSVMTDRNKAELSKQMGRNSLTGDDVQQCDWH